jgi:hypothetical protein
LFALWDRKADFSGAAALGMGILLIVAVTLLTLLSRRFVEGVLAVASAVSGGSCGVAE